MVFNNPSYQRLLNIVCDEDVLLLHHCFAGKDRTGVGAALIYLLLDVPEEQIIKEYLRTEEEMRSNIPKWFKAIKETMNDREEVLKQLSGVKEDYIKEVFSAIK